MSSPRGARSVPWWAVLGSIAILTLTACASGAALEPVTIGSVELEPCPIPDSDEEMLCGSYRVLENRKKARGRTVDLEIAFLPAKKKPKPDPVFYLAGGPGGSAVRRARFYADSWMRRKRDLVFVDQRGTGASNPLQCELPGSPENVQGYLDGDFHDVGVFRRCKKDLERVADLRQYATPTAVDDLDEVRRAMGYERINLIGGSWGTRTALVYLRRHPETIRAAILKSAVPLAVTYPLYHAQGAQRTLDLIFDECAADAACAAAFPNLAAEFDEVLERFANGPLPVSVTNPETGQEENVELPRSAFGEGMRYLMFSGAATRWVPWMVHRTWEGDHQEMAQWVVDYAHALRPLKVGQLMSVVCPGDVARIDEDVIAPLTDGTFMGDTRVRQLIAACRVWPRARMPAGYGEPVESGVPVLLWSGTLDAASRFEWVDEAVPYLKNSRHLVVEAGHVPDHPCIDKVSRKFLKNAKLTGLKTSCTSEIRLRPFEGSG